MSNFSYLDTVFQIPLLQSITPKVKMEEVKVIKEVVVKVIKELVVKEIKKEMVKVEMKKAFLESTSLQKTRENQISMD